MRKVFRGGRREERVNKLADTGCKKSRLVGTDKGT